MCGRPFGGLLRKSLVSCYRVVGVDDYCRCLAVLVTLVGGFKLLVINVYLPCFEAGEAYHIKVADCVGFIENCLVSNTYDSALILGDFNFECVDQSSGYKLMRDMLSDYNIKCCDDLAEPDLKYTYFQNTLCRFSTIDHMFMSE